MMRALAAAVVLALGLHVAVRAQQVSENINVFPVWMPCDPGAGTDVQKAACQSDSRWATAWKYGDIFLQRQVEASFAPSTLNGERLLTAFIDYSAVDQFADNSLGDTVAANNVWTRFTGLLAKLVHVRREKESDRDGDEPKHVASCVPVNGRGCEAWVRLTWSVNGGVTGTPFFMPGAPWDSSPAGVAAPYYGLADGSSDPVVVAAPDGDFHVIFMAFKRGSINFIVDGRLKDLNIPDQPARHGLQFQGFTTLASGNNATFGTLHDKPAAIAVLNPSSPVKYDLWVSYTLFTGNPGGGKFQAHLYVAKSSDGGVTFTIEKVFQSTNEVSGTSLVPLPGNQVGVFARGFGSSPTIYYSARSSSGWSKVSSILSNAYPTLAAFDQGNVKVNSATLASLQQSVLNISPRSNGFPSGAVAPGGTIFVVFQECANSTTGAPLACAVGGSPRVMLMSLKNGVWSERKAVDFGSRSPGEPNGLGYFWNVGRDNNNAHPQLMPAIACGVTQCLVTYWESRTTLLTSNNFIGGYHRIMDLRGALLNADGTLARSFQISRYPYRPGTTLVDASGTAARDETANDIDRVNETIAPDGTRTCVGPAGAAPPDLGLTDNTCIPRLNFYCRPQSGGGTTCFDGDYNAVVAATQFIKSADGSWKVPTSASEVPWVGFLTTSSDNRNLIPPAAALPDQLTQFTAWTHGSNGLPSCTDGGSRNTDTVLARISMSLLVTTPVSSKTSPSPGDAPYITFPIQVWNNTKDTKTVTLNIDTTESTGVHSSFSKILANVVKAVTVDINAYSSTTRVVYVKYTPTTSVSPIHVQVTGGGITTGITLNAPGSQPSAGSTGGSLSVSDPITLGAETLGAETLGAETLGAETLGAETLGAETLGAETLGAETLGAETLGAETLSTQDTMWVINSSGDPTKVYSAIPHIDQSATSGNNFKLVIYRLSSVGACVDANGNASVQYKATVVANTGAANLSGETLGAETLATSDGFPNPANPVNNALFVPKPKKGGTFSSSQSTNCRIGECTEAQLAGEEKEFFVVKLIGAKCGTTETATCHPNTDYNPKISPPALTVADYWCDPRITDPNATGFCQKVQKGSDLVVGTALGGSGTPEVSLTTVVAGQPVQFLPAAGYRVPNNGNLSAGPRQYGFYLSKALDDPTLHLLQTGLVDTTQDLSLGELPFPTPLLPFADPTTPGTVDSVPQQSLTIPLDTLPGIHYLFLYADDLRKVSELDENNNIARSVAITVLPPVYQLIGLFSPCNLLNPCTKSAGSSIPLAWQFSYDGVTPVDSGANKPRLQFYDTSGTLVYTADPNISAGNSQWQYFGASCLPVGSCVRPAYTWQYNAKLLAAGTYNMKIEAPATCQVDVADLNCPNPKGAVAAITIILQ